MSTFRDLIDALPLPNSAEVPELPLTHVTDWHRGAPILESGSIRPPEQCPVYKEFLVYAFYGRAAYVPNGGEDLLAELPYAPMCFIFDAAAGAPTRLMPFDSGGISRYHNIIHHTLVREDFEMTPHVDSARRLVGHFFNTNKSYYRGRPTTLAIDPFQTTAYGYYNLVKSTASSADERRSAIEFQFSSPLTISGHLRAVVIPEDALSFTSVINRLSALGAVPLPYWLPQTYNPFEFRGQLRVIIEDFLTSQGVLK